MFSMILHVAANKKEKKTKMGRKIDEKYTEQK